MKAKKENKVYTINELQKKRYLEQGFDIYDNEGNVLEYSPLKKVLYSEYVKLQKENMALKEENEKLQALLAKNKKQASKE